MTPEQILASNARTLAAAGAAGARLNAADTPFHGYYSVDLFDCPPFTMFSNNDCPRVREILYTRSFEPFSMKLWCRLARTATAIVDMGAHVGVYALAAAALRPDVTVHAFEPNLFAFCRLRVNRSVNGFANLREYYCALAHKNMVTTLTAPAHKGDQINSGARIMAAGIGGQVDETFVAAGPFDGFGIGMGPRGLMKIDVEGSEGMVFDGMKNALAARPDILLETFSPADCDKIDGLIAPLGYRVYRILEDEQRLVPLERLEAIDPNTSDFNQFLTVREPPALA